MRDVPLPESADGIDRIDLLLTAEEAFPVFEREMLAATERIVLSFRVFDVLTRLRSDEGRAIGRDWFDLVAHVLRKGVAIDLLLADFDPIVSPALHRMTWSSLRKLWAAAEIAGPAARFRAVAGIHPFRAGILPRLVLWPWVAREVREVRDWLNGLSHEERRATYRDLPGLHDRIIPDEDGYMTRVGAGPPLLYPVTHHQKVAVFDDRKVYAGGLDLNPRRYDTESHERPGDETWHDIQVLCEGPIAAEARDLVDGLRRTIETRTPLPNGRTGLCSTVSARRRIEAPFLSPHRIRSTIYERTCDEIRKSRDQIYFETQFFRDTGLAKVLAKAGRANPSLQLLMVLPAAPEEIAFEDRRKVDARMAEELQVRCIRTVEKAFGDRCLFVSPAQPRRPWRQHPAPRSRLLGAPLIYVHAKLSVFDTRAVIVSSANLNGRSMHWDTEVGVHRSDPALASDTLERVSGHWRPDAPPIAEGKLVETIRAEAHADAARAPDARTGLLLPYDIEPARRMAQRMPIIPDEMV